MADKVVIDRRLCLTEDKSRVVDETDPDARWLWATPGQEVDREEAERLGALEPEESPEPEAEAEAEVEPPKKRTPAANKSAKPAANKGGLSFPSQTKRA